MSEAEQMASSQDLAKGHLTAANYVHQLSPEHLAQQQAAQKLQEDRWQRQEADERARQDAEAQRSVRQAAVNAALEIERERGTDAVLDSAARLAAFLSGD
jgi:hypothetical protein